MTTRIVIKIFYCSVVNFGFLALSNFGLFLFFRAPEISVEIFNGEDNYQLSSSDSETPDSPLDGSCRVYPLKPRPILQRRNTITGSTPTNKRPYPSIDQVRSMFGICYVD